MKNDDETLLDKAYQNITLAKMIYSELIGDEVYLNLSYSAISSFLLHFCVINYL